MLKLKEKNCFRLVAKKIDCFSPKKKLSRKKRPSPPSPPPQKIKWLLPNTEVSMKKYLFVLNVVLIYKNMLH